MPFCRIAALCAGLLVLTLAACSGGPLRREVIAQARPGGPVAFDVVKLDDAVLAVLAAHRPPPFRARFRQYLPPPELQIAVGDTVGVVIWESGSDGLFGNSLTELSFPAGAAARQETGQQPPALPGAPILPGGLAPAPDLLARLFGAPGGGAAPLGQFLELGTQSGRPGTRIPDQLVGPDGAIAIPYAGRIKVAGRTPAEVERIIEARLGPKALDPQALVVVTRSLANSVAVVAGGVVEGTRVPLSGGGDRLLQVIAAAGGAHAPVHDTVVRLSRGGVTASVPLATLVADPAQDIFARPGDVLTLVRRPRTVSVFGAAGKVGTVTFTADRLSLAEALAKAGGLLDERADPRAVFLFRYAPASVVRALGQPVAGGAPPGLAPIVFRLDLRQAKSYLLARRFAVHDKDVIFVADAPAVRVNHLFQVLSQVTGPIETGFLVCHNSKSC